jgi:hypothetical protein
MTNKTCTKCLKEFPATKEFFHKDSYSKDKLNSKCKSCISIIKKEEYKKYKPRIKATAKKYRETDKVKNYQRNYQPKYKQDNKEQITNRMKIYAIKYTNKNRKKLNNLNNIHAWARRHKPKQDYCSICNEIKRVELSNLSGNYNKNLSDWWHLCRSCHGLFDRINKTHKNKTPFQTQ